MYENIIATQQGYIHSLKATRDNRKSIKSIVTLLNTKKIMTLQGIKHVGKTQLIADLIQKTQSQDTTFYYNALLDSMHTIQNRQDVITLLDMWIRIYGVPKMIVLQNCGDIHDIESLIIELYKTKKYKIIIVGNTIKIQGAPIYNLFPLDYERGNISASLLGGLPDVRNIPDIAYKKRLLSNIKNDSFLTDIVLPYNLKNVDTFQSTISFLSQNSSYMSQREMHRQLKLHNIDISLITLTEYLHQATSVHLLKKCLRYDCKIDKAISTQVKYYFGDVGIRQAWNMEAKDMQKNLIYISLESHGYEIFGGINGRFEFSFYAKRNDGTSLAIAFEQSSDKNEIRKTARKLAKIENAGKKYLIVSKKEDLGMRKFEESGVHIITLSELEIS